MSDTSKYAVVVTGGKQYHVTPGERIVVGKLAGDVGESVTLEQVLLVGTTGAADAKHGKPYVSGAKVVAKIVSQERSAKVIIFKKRRRKGYMKKQGHRQDQTRLVIESVVG